MMQVERMMEERITRMKADVVNDVLAYLTSHGWSNRSGFTRCDGACCSKFVPRGNPSDPISNFKDMSRWDDYSGFVNILADLNKAGSLPSTPNVLPPDGKIAKMVTKELYLFFNF